MTEALQILGFGAIAVDQLIYVDQPLCSGKGKVTKRITAHGGNVATALVAAATLGAKAGFIGWLNDTAQHASGYAEDMQMLGVDISLAPRSPDATPINSVITVGSDGDRFIAYDDNVMIGTSLDLADSVLAQAKILMIDSYAISSIPIVQRARTLGVEITTDIEWSAGEPTQQIIDLSDHLVLPWGFASQYTSKTTAYDLLNILWSNNRKSVVLTNGADGTFVRQAADQQFWHIPALTVDTVDTTGAGDCFHGAYAHALSLGKTPLESVQYASIAAALSTTGHGGRSALPSHENCMALLARDDAPKPALIS